MKLSKNIQRKLIPLLRLLERDQVEEAKQLLEELLELRVRHPGLVPVPPPSPLPTASTVAQLARARAEIVSEVEGSSPSSGCSGGISQPKPPKRIVDPKAITRYKKAHPECEVVHDHWGPLDFSHILPKSKAGPDRAYNGMTLCRRAHDEWHRSRIDWWRKYQHRISPENKVKILKVYPELNEEGTDWRSEWKRSLGSIRTSTKKSGETDPG